MDKVFKALADPTRRQLLDRLRASNGQSLGELCAHLEMSRQAVTKHLGLLEEANLVVVLWRSSWVTSPWSGVTGAQLANH
jgi:DNA-binding transcriptional ArsR family regulator